MKSMGRHSRWFNVMERRWAGLGRDWCGETLKLTIGDDKTVRVQDTIKALGR